MFTIHYIDFLGVSDEESRMDFNELADAQRVFDAIASNFTEGKYKGVVEIALYDESIEEMLASTNA